MGFEPRIEMVFVQDVLGARIDGSILAGPVATEDVQYLVRRPTGPPDRTLAGEMNPHVGLQIIVEDEPTDRTVR